MILSVFHLTLFHVPFIKIYDIYTRHNVSDFVYTTIGTCFSYVLLRHFLPRGRSYGCKDWKITVRRIFVQFKMSTRTRKVSSTETPNDQNSFNSLSHKLCYNLSNPSFFGLFLERRSYGPRMFLYIWYSLRFLNESSARRLRKELVSRLQGKSLLAP